MILMLNGQLICGSLNDLIKQPSYFYAAATPV